MNQNELQRILTECAAERVALVQRHEAGARVVSHYDFNNTYQYIVNREETHLRWLRDALGEIGQPFPAAASTIDVPAVQKTRKVEPSAFRAVLEDDSTRLAAFVQKWTPRIAPMTHVRHRKMLEVILGESLEHARLFGQAASGFEDLLGRRTGGVARQGGVLPTRWME